MKEEDEDVFDRIRRELISLMERQHKILERDLLRLSAITGVDYSTILRIQEEIPRKRLLWTISRRRGRG